MSRGRSITEFAVLVILLPILAFPPASSTNDYQHEHLRLMVATVDSGRLGPAGFQGSPEFLPSHLIFWHRNTNIDSGMLVILIAAC